MDNMYCNGSKGALEGGSTLEKGKEWLTFKSQVGNRGVTKRVKNGKDGWMFREKRFK